MHCINTKYQKESVTLLQGSGSASVSAIHKVPYAVQAEKVGNAIPNVNILQYSALRFLKSKFSTDEKIYKILKKAIPKQFPKIHKCKGL